MCTPRDEQDLGGSPQLRKVFDDEVGTASAMAIFGQQ
jgi:hypothetical protein